jgi:hypothetical protein
MTVQSNNTPLAVPKRIGDLSAVFGYIVLCAPDRFPTTGARDIDQRLLLEKNFERLSLGLHLAKSRLKDKSQMVQIEELICTSLDAYRNGDRWRGAKLLQNAGHVIWPGRFGHDASVA